MIADDGAISEFEHWAREELKVPHDATMAAVRSAFLKRIQEERFSPSELATEAYQILSERRDRDKLIAVSADARREVAARLRERVERFASEFFDLPVDVRAARWQTLRDAAQSFPRILARLSRLKEGLAVAVQPAVDAAPQVQKLQDACCELFVLRPATAAVRRQKLTSEFTARPVEWIAAAETLRKQSPEVASLVPQLTDWLLTYADLAKRDRRLFEKARLSRQAAGRQAASRQRGTPVQRPSKLKRRIVVGVIVPVALMIAGVAVLDYQNAHRPINEPSEMLLEDFKKETELVDKYNEGRRNTHEQVESQLLESLMPGRQFAPQPRQSAVGADPLTSPSP